MSDIFDANSLWVWLQRPKPHAGESADETARHFHDSQENTALVLAQASATNQPILWSDMSAVFTGKMDSEKCEFDAAPEWTLAKSADRYLRLFWLLSDERLLFLRAHGGFTRELNIRRRRAAAFLRHLNELRQEFKSTCTALKTVMLQSPRDRPDLAARLVRAEVSFACGVLMVRFRLWRYRFGFR